MAEPWQGYERTGFVELMLEPRTERDCCARCNRRVTWLRHRVYGWCSFCGVLLVKDPATHALPRCEYGDCSTPAEFVAVVRGIDQTACRQHIGPIANGPREVYGLSDRAIDAVAKWRRQ